MSKVELNKKFFTSNGLVLPDLILGMVFLVTFGLIVASTSSLMNNILKLNSFTLTQKDYLSEINLVKVSLIEWAEILSQPVYSKEEINNMNCSSMPSSPKTIWNIPHKPATNPPENYLFCISPTAIVESDSDRLILGKDNAKPGLYILYAKPIIKSSNFPFIRIIFCRPRVFCKS